MCRGTRATVMTGIQCRNRFTSFIYFNIFFFENCVFSDANALSSLESQSLSPITIGMGKLYRRLWTQSDKRRQTNNV